VSEQKSKFAERLQAMTPKQKQYLLLGSVAAIFFGLIIGSVKLWGNKPINEQKTHAEIKTKDITVPGAQVNPQDVWMAQSSKEIAGMNDAMQAMQQKMDAMQKEKATQPNAGTGAPSTLPPLPPIPPMPQPSKSSTPINTSSALPPLPEQPAAPPKEPGIMAVEVSDAAPQQAASVKDQSIYVPSGSFMRAVLLGGLDASTGGQAQNNPWPVLMRVQNNAFLPNRYRAQVKECFVLGSGYGDLSSERAFLRLESLSCVLKDGQVIDTSAKGYVVGEDGKAGMRGRLISKQGQVLANALLTGLVSGIGQGVSMASTNYSMSPLGGVGIVPPGQQVEAGVGAGIGTSLGSLSQYYMKLADKIFPIIEIDAGRVIDIVLTKGITLGIQSSGDAGGDQYSDVWKRGREIQNQPIDALNTETQ
jgi:conjugal transfer pilus assembly protein TraB